jgi:capsular polysaccharide biosynthesis protein
LLGYSRSDWVVWSDPGIRVDSLVVPTYPEPTPGNLSWLRSQLQQQVEPATDEPSRIYISRDRSDKRLVENEHEVREVVAEFGFEPYFLEELTVEEQVRLFGSADAVVGPHGAGLTNVIWGDDLTVFELFPEDVYDLYGVISSLLGHAYHGLQFTSVTPRLGINSNLNVDVDALHSYLDSNLSD